MARWCVSFNHVPAACPRLSVSTCVCLHVHFTVPSSSVFSRAPGQNRSNTMCAASRCRSCRSASVSACVCSCVDIVLYFLTFVGFAMLCRGQAITIQRYCGLRHRKQELVLQHARSKVRPGFFMLKVVVSPEMLQLAIIYPIITL